MIEDFLSHRDTRLRAYAAELIARDAAARRQRAEWALAEEREYEEYAEKMRILDEVAERALEETRALDEARALDEGARFDDDAIPF